MRIAVCDDSMEMLDELCFFLRQIEVTSNADIERYTKSDDLVKQIEKGHGFDLYILDIYIDKTLGTDIAKTIRTHDEKASIIFISSTPEFALESYRFRALHYLIKPISFVSLRDAVMRMDLGDAPSIISMTDSGDRTKVLISDIICIVNNRNRQNIITMNGASYVNSTMKAMEQQLASNKSFYRLNSGVIINLSKVQRINAKEIELSGENVFSVPRGRYRAIKSICSL